MSRRVRQFLDDPRAALVVLCTLLALPLVLVPLGLSSRAGTLIQMSVTLLGCAWAAWLYRRDLAPRWFAPKRCPRPHVHTSPTQKRTLILAHNFAQAREWARSHGIKDWVCPREAEDLAGYRGAHVTLVKLDGWMDSKQWGRGWNGSFINRLRMLEREIDDLYPERAHA